METTPPFGDLRVFDYIYKTNFWGQGSGGGSSEEATRKYRSYLERFIQKRNIRTVVDLGCGDWQFSKLIKWGRTRYRGYDVAETVIQTNGSKYASELISFHLLRNYSELPVGDLLICKDVLQHLSRDEVQRVINEAFPKYKYILLTNCVPKVRFPFRTIAMVNKDILTGKYCYFDISKEPYSLRCQTVLRYKVNPESYPQFAQSIYREAPVEGRLSRLLNFPYRAIRKTLHAGRDCEWLKEVVLLEN